MGVKIRFDCTCQTNVNLMNKKLGVGGAGGGGGVNEREGYLLSGSHLFKCVTIDVSQMRTTMHILVQSSGLICMHMLYVFADTIFFSEKLQHHTNLKATWYKSGMKMELTLGFCSISQYGDIQ